MLSSRSLSLAALLLAMPLCAQDTQQPSVPPPASVGAPVSAGAINAATVRGTITDPDQAVIPGATITLVPAKGKGNPIVKQSGADGTYEIKNVPNGTYTITVTMPGFASVVRQNVKLTETQSMTMNVKMAIEEQATEVNVTTTSNQVSVDPDSNASSVVIKGKDLDALSDDPDELQSELTALAGPAAGPNGGQIYVDGFTGGQLPPKSSIREIRVNQNPFSAQYDKPGYGRIEVLTKPGTDKFHGRVMAMGNHSSFNTRSPFLKGDSVVPSYFQTFNMGSLSGPINKAMSFTVNGSYRDTEDNAVVSGKIISTSPTDATLCPPGNSACALYDFPSQFAATPVSQIRRDFSPRVDLGLGEKNTLTVRYQYEANSSRNRAVGGNTLSTYRSNSDSTEHEIQIGDSIVVSPKVVNETRFEWRHNFDNLAGVNPDNLPTIAVQGAFTGGYNGNNSSTTGNRYELQNYTSVALTKHFLRMGGRWRFYDTHTTSTSGTNGSFQYAQLGSLTAVNAYLQNKPYQLTLTHVNTATVGLTALDIGLYLEDDWKVKPNLTLSGGLRYEAQTRIDSAHDLAPRVSLAWGIPRKNGTPITVIRLGAGVFYDRFDNDDVLTTVRQNGINQVQNIYLLNSADGSVVNTTCNPNAPLPQPTCGSSSTTSSQTKYILDPAGVRSEYNLQFAAGVDQQLSKTATLSVNFISSNGNHTFLSRSSVNSGTYTYYFSSGGMYRQQQLIANTRWNPSQKFSLFGYYVYSHAMGNANGSSTFATDSINSATDYGRTGFNRTHRIFFFGNLSLPWAMSASPFIVATSGQPYNILVGTDVNSDSIVNDRAAFVTGRNSANCANINDFLPASNSGYSGNNYTRIPAYYCTAQATATINLRVGKSFGFGKKTSSSDAGVSGNSGRSSRGSMGGSSRGGGSRSGRGPMMMGMGGDSSHKYNFNIGVQAFNLFNMVPYGAPQGNLSTPSTFGRPITLQASGFGGGSSGGSSGSNSAVRRIFLQASFSF